MGKASRGNRGIYYQRAKEEGWHAETLLICYRLMRNIACLKGVKPMVDLCTVPCSWSQVLSHKLYLPVNPSPDVRHFDGCKVDLVCDGAPNDRSSGRLGSAKQGVHPLPSSVVIQDSLHSLPEAADGET